VRLTQRAPDWWEIARNVPESSPNFSQRFPFTFANEDNTMIGTSQISYDNETWNDDLAITYRRIT
jgi:hypothetical protein